MGSGRLRGALTPLASRLLPSHAWPALHPSAPKTPNLGWTQACSGVLARSGSVMLDLVSRTSGSGVPRFVLG